MLIYQPAEDSYLLSESVNEYLKNKNKYINILDMGSGSGIQTQTCKKLGFNNILAADINPDSIKILKQKGFNTIHTDLFSNINPNEKFDLIIFNPPYLPEDKREPKDSKLATTAGKQGYEIITKFLKQAKKHLEKHGKILLLFSSLSKPNIIKKQAERLGYNYKKLDFKKIAFEQLYVYLFEVV
jgi:release factor glutamine methyltransferase